MAPGADAGRGGREPDLCAVVPLGGNGPRRALVRGDHGADTSAVDFDLSERAGGNSDLPPRPAFDKRYGGDVAEWSKALPC